MLKKIERPTPSIKAILISVAIGLILTLAFLLLAAVLIEQERLSEGPLRLWSLCAVFLGTLPAATLAARRQRLLGAAAVCLILFLLFLLGGSALFSGVFDMSGILSLCAVYLAAMLGGTVLSGCIR